MAPTTERLDYESLRPRVQLLTSLGIPFENIKIHPDCQRDVCADLTTRRRAEWKFIILRAFIGTDEFVLNALLPKNEKNPELN